MAHPPPQNGASNPPSNAPTLAPTPVSQAPPGVDLRPAFEFEGCSVLELPSNGPPYRPGPGQTPLIAEPHGDPANHQHTNGQVYRQPNGHGTVPPPGNPTRPHPPSGLFPQSMNGGPARLWPTPAPNHRGPETNVARGTNQYNSIPIQNSAPAPPYQSVYPPPTSHADRDKHAVNYKIVQRYEDKLIENIEIASLKLRQFYTFRDKLPKGDSAVWHQNLADWVQSRLPSEDENTTLLAPQWQNGLLMLRDSIATSLERILVREKKELEVHSDKLRKEIKNTLEQNQVRTAAQIGSLVSRIRALEGVEEVDIENGRQKRSRTS